MNDFADIQAIARGERCSTRVLYLGLFVGWFAALGAMFVTWNALAGVLVGAAVYFCIVLAGSANR